MNYYSMLEGLLTIGEGKSNINNFAGIEYVQNAEKRKVHKVYMLPKNMKPNKKQFESLGFTFEDVGDNILYLATLPEGWKLKSEGNYWTAIIDEKGRPRGNYFYRGDFYERRGYMCLMQRFHATFEYIDPKGFRTDVNVVAKDADGTILFKAGYCSTTHSVEYDELLKKAEEYLNTNYPKWKNLNEYWD